MSILTGIKRQKKKNFLVISASGQNQGLQVLYVEIISTEWTIINERVIKYPEELNSLITIVKDEKSKISLRDLSKLDQLFSEFLYTMSKDILSALPKAKKNPDIVILNKLVLWTGEISSSLESSDWVFTAGNASYLATKLGTPVVSDFIERSVSENRANFLPTLNGDSIIASRISGPALFANIGLRSRLTAIGAPGYPIIMDRDCGPATELIDMVAEKIGLNQGLDRDGNEALNGSPDTNAIEIMQESFLSNPFDFKKRFRKLLNSIKFKKLSSSDLLATVTAFAAFTIINSYRSNYKNSEKPDSLWISGGGTNNLALVNYLKGYFAPIKVKNIEELGVNGGNRIPLSLALTVNSWIEGEDILLPPEINNSIKNIATWYLP